MFGKDWNNEWVPTGALLVSWGRLAGQAGQRGVSLDATLALVMAELLGPMIPAELSHAQLPARNAFVRAITHLRTHPGFPALSLATAATFAAYILDGDTGIEEEAQPAFIASWDAPTEIFDHAYAILIHIMNNTLPAFQITGVTLLANVYCAVPRRSQVTDLFATKVQTGIFDDLGMRISIRADALRIFYNKFGWNINRQNIGIVLNHWQARLPAEALRLSLVVQQAANSRLTALVVIGRALQRYRNFRRDAVAEIYRDKWAACIVALQAVNGDAYYGFSLDLGNVKSTLYKNLAWVSKELLFRVGGETSLRGYAGWVTRAREQAAMDALIAGYENNRNDVIQGTLDAVPWVDASSANVLTAIGLVEAHPGL